MTTIPTGTVHGKNFDDSGGDGGNYNFNNTNKIDNNSADGVAVLRTTRIGLERTFSASGVSVV